MGLIRKKDTSWTFFNIVTSEIPGNGAANIESKSNGDIWFSSFESNGENYIPLGLVMYNGTKFYHFEESNSKLPTNDITAIKAANDGSIWVGTNGKGLIHIK